MLAALLLQQTFLPPAPKPPKAQARFGGAPVYWPKRQKRIEERSELPRIVVPPDPVFPELKALPQFKSESVRIERALKQIEEEDELMQVFLLADD